MARETKTRALTYKRAAFHNSGPKLSTLLRAVLKKSSTVGDRRQLLAPPEEAPIWLVIGQAQPEREWVFGVLMRYAPGTNPQFVVDDPSATALTVEQLAAPMTAAGKRRELMNSLLYFGALDNHVVVMQGGLRAGQLEAHLQWLLHQAGVLAGTNALKLVDQPTKATREIIKKRPVRAIVVGGDLDSTPVMTQPSAGGGRSTASVTAGTARLDGDERSAVVQAIMSLISPDKASQLNLDALTGSNIEYTLRLTYSRKTSDQGQKLMNAMGVAFRDVEDLDTTLQLVGGDKLNGSDLRVTGPVRIETFDGAPSTTAVFEIMRAWLLQKVSSEEVLAE